MVHQFLEHDIAGAVAVALPLEFPSSPFPFRVPFLIPLEGLPSEPRLTCLICHIFAGVWSQVSRDQTILLPSQQGTIRTPEAQYTSETMPATSWRSTGQSSFSMDFWNYQQVLSLVVADLGDQLHLNLSNLCLRDSGSCCLTLVLMNFIPDP